MGRELLRAGAPFRQPEWSALALMEAPELVLEAHRRFATAGSDVLTTNSYALVPFHIGRDRFVRDGSALADLAGRQARIAADAAGIRVAGSLPPTLGSYRPDLFDKTAARPILEQLIHGLEQHVDLWLAETLSAVAEAEAVLDVLPSDRRPLWLSFTLSDGRDAHGSGSVLRSGEPVDEAAKFAKQSGVAALLFNCSQPEIMEPAIRAAGRLLEGSNIALGVYANAFPPTPSDAVANTGLSDIRADMAPVDYLGWAQRWAAAGASIVGGCCGIGPEHIALLSSRLGDKNA